MKQIINGVDVSGCPYKYKNDNYCNLYEDECTECSTCDYKQLRRKEEECNTYKQALDKIEKKCLKEQNFMTTIYDSFGSPVCASTDTAKFAKKILQIIQK